MRSHSWQQNLPAVKTIFVPTCMRAVLYDIPQGCNTISESLPMASPLTRFILIFLSHVIYRHVYLSRIFPTKHLRLFNFFSHNLPCRVAYRDVRALATKRLFRCLRAKLVERDLPEGFLQRKTSVVSFSSFTSRIASFRKPSP